VYSTRIQRQLRTSSGLIGYSLRARLASKRFWTLSAWEDAATLQAFVAARNKSGSQKSESPSQLIDARIKELGDWRGEMLSRLRTLVKEADPEIVEEWKWRGVPVWKHDGIICTGETYKNVVKMTFAKGAALKRSFGPLQLQS